MAISAAIAAGLKTALKTAASSTIKANGFGIGAQTATQALTIGKKISSQGLQKVVSQGLTDGQAVLLNRLKAQPSRIMMDFVSNEMGIPVNELHQLVGAFKQTPQQRQAALGSKFKGLAQKHLKNELGVNNSDRIKDIYRKTSELNQQHRNLKRTEGRENDNIAMYSALKELEIEVFDKINGSYTAAGGVVDLTPPDLLELFDTTADYQQFQTAQIQKLSTDITADVEHYTDGSGGDIVIIQDGNSWSIHSFCAIEMWLHNFETKVRDILGLGNVNNV